MSKFPAFILHNQLQPASLLGLPNEILYYIIQDLPLSAMAAFSETCRTNSVITNPILTKLKQSDWEGVPAIHYASSQGSVPWVMSLLSLGISPNHQVPTTLGTPLHYVVSAGHKDVLLCLIKNKADVNAHDRFGDTPLHIAIQEGSYGCASELIRHGANVDAVNGNDHTPLRQGMEILHRLGKSKNPGDAIRFKDVESTIMILLSGGADVRRVDINRQTMVHFASSQKSVLVLEMILSKGGREDVNAEESFGLTPLHIAAIEGQDRCAAALLRSGAFVDAVSSEENTPLHVAIMGESGAAIQTLLNAGASPNIFNRAGYTPLALAAYYGYADCIRAICEGPQPICWSPEVNALALYMAVKQHHEAAVKVLLHSGAKESVNVQWKSANARTALHEAVLSGDSGIVWLLVRHGADVWIADGDGKCCGCWAFEKGHYKMIRMFHNFS